MHIDLKSALSRLPLPATPLVAPRRLGHNRVLTRHHVADRVHSAGP